MLIETIAVAITTRVGQAGLTGRTTAVYITLILITSTVFTARDEADPRDTLTDRAVRINETRVTSWTRFTALASAVDVGLILVSAFILTCRYNTSPYDTFSVQTIGFEGATLTLLARRADRSSTVDIGLILIQRVICAVWIEADPRNT